MKRDMDLIRRIVLAVRDTDDVVSRLDDVESGQFAEHAQLLEEAGLIAAAIRSNGKRPATEAVIFRLTWAGQDFADAIRDDTLWSRAKEAVIKPTASWTFGVLLRFLEVEITSGISSFRKSLF